MRFVYSEWNEALYQKLKNMADLMAIYNFLLLRMNGDAEETLKLMERLQAQGILDKKLNLDEFKKQLERSKLISRQNDGKINLSSKGERVLRQDAFDHIFNKLRSGGKGQHPLPHGGGTSEEPLPERRRFTFGDSIRLLDYNASLFNSVKRTGDLDLSLSEDDLEVFDSEKLTSSATVLMIDISHSMILYGEDRITPAKQVAMAFTEMILNKFPRDSLSVVLFGDEAYEVSIQDLPYIGVGPFHTNTQAGLRLARKILLGKKHVNRQIFMITDGKPSVITRPNGEIYRNSFGLDPRIVNRTLDEAVLCRKKRIPITTFMVTDDPYLQQFVQQLTELNRGRAYFSSVDNLGKYVFWDFVSNRKKRR
jgi:uncharacterized protein with von Willebrand factor type A (vWA) domain